MRTTLTLDDDVAALVAQARSGTGIGLKELINQALRLGFREMQQQKKTSTNRVYTRPASLGHCRVPIVSASEALALSEGDGFR